MDGMPEGPGLEKYARRILHEANQVRGIFRPVELSLTITNDSFIKKLNNAHRNKNHATDVLSFPFNDFPDPISRRRIPSSMIPPGDFLPLGDVVISVDTAAHQAVTIGHTLEDEILRLMVHGILHLLGYDHERSSKERALMEKEEDRILALI